MRTLLLLLGIFLFKLSYSQTTNLKYCGISQAMEQEYLKDPSLKEKLENEQEEFKAFVNEFSKTNHNRSATCDYIYVIPVVFHILHEGGSENISDEQILDEMRILNENFKLRNADTSEIVVDFKPIAGVAQIEFRLAKKDPNGNPTNGIVRYNTPETNDADDNIKPSRAWPRNQYLNLFVVKSIASGAAGYTYRPSNWLSSYQDAITVLYNYVGSIGTSSPNKSKTLTHEVGHWLNLKHTWGGTNDPALTTNCQDDDDVSDTPNTIGYQSCNLAGTSCSSLDNVQNYMDYSYCSVMFTQGQATRMQAALASSTAERNNLSTGTNLAATGTDQLSFAELSVSEQIVCKGSSVHFTDLSEYGPTTWTWTLNGGAPSTSSACSPQVTYNTPGLYSVSLFAGNGSQTKSVTKSNYIFVTDPLGRDLPYSEGFEDYTALPNNSWLVLNDDNSLNKWELSSGTAYSGNNAAVMKNFNNVKEAKDNLISETVDLRPLESAQFSFQYAYAQIGSSFEKIRLYFSNDCGSTWTSAWTGFSPIIYSAPATNSDFVPSGQSEWLSKTVSISSANLVEGFMYKFEFESDSGNNFYVDDINISGTYHAYPILESPADGSQYLSDHPTINWKAVENVAEYEYQLDTTDLFNSSQFITGTKTYISIYPNNSDTEFETADLLHSQKYYWRVRTVTGGTPSAWSDTWEFNVSANGVGYEETINSGQLNMKIFPNPLEAEGWVTFTLDEVSKTSISIYDLLGKEVAHIHSGTLNSGNHSIKFDARSLNKGMYLLKLTTNGKSKTNKLIIR